MEQQPQTTSLFQLSIDASASSTLRSASTWAKVLGILGIIFGIMFIAAGFIFQEAMKSSYNNYEEFGGGYRNQGMLADVGMIFYMVMGALTIIGSIFAISFGSKIAAALRTNDQNTLRGGFAGVRNYFAFWSILMLISLLLAIIGIASGSMYNM